MKQSLRKRDTYTPTNAPQVRSNCDPDFKQSCSRRDGEQDLKTFFNSPDEGLTPRERGGQNLRVSVVYVLNLRGQPLMPTTPRRAKQLLKKGEAHVVNRIPFTIQLDKTTGETKQKVVLGIDPGYSSIGISAVTEKKELISLEVQLRVDMVKLLSEKRSYRKTRRNRKTRYRKCRFLNRNIPKGWLAPSIQHKLDTYIKIVNKVSKILPIISIKKDKECFIFGRRSTGYFDIRKLGGKKISNSVKYTKLKLLEKFKTLLIERKE